MDASELSRWTRFAAKGGIGKCTASQDCVAKHPEDLMFLKGDEITVLMQLTDQKDAYLGYCEGVVGRFDGAYVHFHSKLKTPVMTKRSSNSRSSLTPRNLSTQSPVPSIARSITLQDDDVSLHSLPTSPPPSRPSRLSLVSSPIIQPSMSDTSDVSMQALSPQMTEVLLPTTPFDFPTTETYSKHDPLPARMPTLDSMNSRASSYDKHIVGEPSAVPFSSPIPPPVDRSSPNPTESSLSSAIQDRTLDDSLSVRISRVSVASDGVSGIGLSLLQDFVTGDDEDDVSSLASHRDSQSSDRRSPSPSSIESTVEGPPGQSTPNPPPTSDLAPQVETFQMPSPPLPPPAEPKSPSLSMVPSESEFGGEDWEGASDIYDNYRYSRMSMASKMSRMSKMSTYTGADIPPPVPLDFDFRRPSIDRPPSEDPAGRRSENSHYSEELAESSTAIASHTDEPKRVPPALVLEDSNKHRTTPSEYSETPLLHTTFGSPMSSPALQTSSSMYDTSPSTADFDHPPDGAASALIQEMESDQGPTSPTPNPTSQSFYSEVAETRPIVVDDDEPEYTTATEAAPQAGPSRPVSPSVIAARTSEASPFRNEKKRGALHAPLVVVNQAPPPPYTPTSPTLPSHPSVPLISPVSATFNTMPAPVIPPVQQQPYPPSAPYPNNPYPNTYTQSQGQPQPRPRPQPQLDAGEHPFGSARTSIFLPHPNAPKPTPAPMTMGPMYGRKQPAPPPHPNTGSIVHTLRMAAAARFGPTGVPRLTTIYGLTETELTESMGPVPISFFLEPPNNIPAHRVAMRRTATVGAGVADVGQGTAPVGLGFSSAGNGMGAGPVGQEQGQGQRQEQGSGASQIGNVIPRANFYPKVRAARPRSRSFSGFDSPFAENSLGKERSREEPAASLSSTSDGSNSPQFHNPKSVLGQRQHTPSPLSLSQNAVVSSTASLSPASASPVTEKVPPPPPPAPLGRLSASQSNSSLRIAATSPPPMNTSSLRQVTTALAPAKELVTSPVAGSPKSMRKPIDYPSSLSAPNSPSSSSAADGRESVTSTSKASDGLSQRGPSMHRQQSIDTIISNTSDGRSMMASPPPTAGPSLVRNTSLRSKLSLSALRAKSSIANMGAREDTSSAQAEAGGEMVQVEDMDFELVRPNLPTTFPARGSEDSTVLGRGSLTADAPLIPGKMDLSAFLRADSPATTNSNSPVPRSPVSPADSGNALPKPSKPGEVEAHRARELKWIAAMSSIPPSQARKSKKIRKLLAEGVPASVRYQVWAHLTDSKARRLEGLYAQLGKRARVSRLEDIEKDARECFEGQGHLAEPGGPLVSLLQAYLTMVPDIQYDRGLAIIAGHLLQQSPEEDAFWIFISLMDTYLRPYFSSNAIQMDVDASLFAKAVEAIDPSVAKKLFVDMGIQPVRVCRPWFSSLFADTLPTEYFLRVWDIFLCEGVAFLFRVGLAVITCCRRALLDSTSDTAVLELLRRPPSVLLSSSPDTLVELATSVKLKDDDVRKQRTKMEAMLKRQTQVQAQARVLAQGQAQAISLPRS
ncbi:hypothetical protein EW146_g5336 [Bondarzewia mesenterica]|uniref:Rab-GAP TBC domain-containing protein n=1 Tax=Bondarzewia mesenterica TaxID=1095465 RepID=A0A4S4LSG7_9AGAM|nr:hypothetical protein EW146_g5336 [Bondarzewia mesenterica]